MNTCAIVAVVHGRIYGHVSADIGLHPAKCVPSIVELSPPIMPVRVRMILSRGQDSFWLKQG